MRAEQGGLLALVSERLQESVQVSPPRSPGILEGIGRSSKDRMEQGVDLLAFIGETVMAILRTALRPRRMRWAALFAIPK